MTDHRNAIIHESRTSAAVLSTAAAQLESMSGKSDATFPDAAARLLMLTYDQPARSETTTTNDGVEM